MSKPSVIDPHVGRAIRRKRLAAGLSLDKLAAAAGVSKVCVWEIENLRTNPSFFIVRNIARALSVSLDSLAEAEGGKP